MTKEISSGSSYVDRGWAWIILLASMSIMIILQGSVRSFGIFVVELQREFETTAAAISSILSIQAIANCITCFFVLNCLTKMLSLRVLIIVGCFCSAFCFILDFQATNIKFVTAIHILNGMGIAFMYGPTIVIIGHYFVKYRGTANALTSCGASIGQFALSPLFSFLVFEYGIKGALLLNGGIFIQCITFAMLLRPNSFFVRIKEAKVDGEITCMMGNEDKNVIKSVQSVSNGSIEEEQLETLLVVNNKHYESTGCQYLENGDSYANSENKTNIVSLNISKNETDKPNLVFDQTTKTGGKKVAILKESILSNLKSIFLSVDFKLFKQPIFITYFFGSSISQLASSIPQSFFPSHAEDMGLSRSEGMLFVAIAGFADLGGRILTTLIADQRYLNRPRFLGSVLIIHGIVACFTPFFLNFPSFSAYCALYGASGGIVFAISTTILTDYIGIEKLSQGLGLMLFFNGFASAGSYLFTGFFREFIGSYTPGFIINGISLIISGVLFCVEACIKYEKHSQK